MEVGQGPNVGCSAKGEKMIRREIIAIYTKQTQKDHFASRCH
jgi:hypothetical protein